MTTVQSIVFDTASYATVPLTISLRVYKNLMTPLLYVLYIKHTK
jgi:hypothetical protein